MVFCCGGLWYNGNIRDAYWTSFWGGVGKASLSGVLYIRSKLGFFLLNKNVFLQAVFRPNSKACYEKNNKKAETNSSKEQTWNES